MKMTTEAATERVSRELWAQAAPHAFQSLFHPFVAGLAAGTLPEDAFRAFLLQDAYYLTGFAKAYAYALTKVGDASHVMALIRMLHGVEEELARTHASFLKEDGVDVFAVHDDSLAMATKNYVGFLLDTASRANASAAEILAAMTPCARLYAFLGEKIREAQEAIRADNAEGLKANPYQRWIDAYASPGFQEAAATMERLLDELAIIDSANVEVLAARYHRAMELELQFFEEFFPFRHSRDHSATVNLRSMLSNSAAVVLLDRCTNNASPSASACSSVVKAGWKLAGHGSSDKTLSSDLIAKGMRKLEALDTGSYDISSLVKAIAGPNGFAGCDGESVHCSEACNIDHTFPLLSAVMLGASWTHGVEIESALRVFNATQVEEVAALLKALSLEGDFAWYSSSCRDPLPNGSKVTKSTTVPRVLTIAGSDSGGGAGIQADMKACANLGVFSASAITAVTVQNTHGVHGIHAVPVNTIRNQISCVLDDIGADVVKTGMLFNEEIILAVAETLQSRNALLVVDPVMVATSGDRLLKDAALNQLVTSLFPLATIITPNIPEASALLADRPITSVDEMKAAAKDLASLGPLFVLVKGGHLPFSTDGNNGTDTGDGSQQQQQVHDVLYDAERQQFHVFSNPKLSTRNTHGTGCTLASAIAAQMAIAVAASGENRGNVDIAGAVQSAIAYLHRILRQSQGMHIGGGDSQPMLHVA